MIHFDFIKLSNGIDEDFILTINEDYTSTANINEKFGQIPVNIGVATYSVVSGIPNFNWSTHNGYKFYLISDSPFIELKKITDTTPIKLPTNSGTYYTIAGDQNKIIQVSDELLMAVDFGIFSPGETAWVRNVKPDESFVWVSYESGSFQVQFNETFQFAILGEPNDLMKFNYTEINVEESEFKCVQPDFIGGVEEGSTYVLISAPEIPNGVRIYLNSGEFGYVKSEQCLIKLDTPLIAESEIWCFINTEFCNVESCKYVVGSVISGNAGCLSEDVNLPQGTLVGTFICLGKDYYAEEWDGYGNKVLGTLIQEDCIYCGGELPNCEEVP